MTAKYPTEAQKLSFVAQGVSGMKREAIRTMGVGTDLCFVLYGWTEDEMSCVASIHDTLMSDLEARFSATINAGFGLRRGYQVEQFTLMTDGYCVPVESEPTDESLDVRFANGDPLVSECLTLTHVDKWQPRATIVTLPYRVVPGPDVEFGEPSYREDDLETPFVKYLSLALDADYDPELDLAEMHGIFASNGVQMAGIPKRG